MHSTRRAPHAQRHVCGCFYTLSVNDGFRILVSEQDHMSMPPLVKISDNHLTVSEWDQIRALGESTQEGKLSSHISVIGHS